MVIISKCERQPVVCYFIERKAKDNKANKDYNNLGSKTFSMFRYGHVQKLSKRLPLMEPTFVVNVCLKRKKTLKYNLTLSCPTGKALLASHKHIASLH